MNAARETCWLTLPDGSRLEFGFQDGGEALPELSGTVRLDLPEGSRRLQRESAVRALHSRMEPGTRLRVAARDLSSAVLKDLLTRHFKQITEEDGGVTGLRRNRKKKKVLLLYPPVICSYPTKFYCTQPTALLRLSGHLKNKGVHVVFHDMIPMRDYLDYGDLLFKEMAEDFIRIHRPRRWGSGRCGNFEQEKRTKPLYLFGEDFDRLTERLEGWHFVEEVYISSVFTYHYIGTHEAVKRVRESWPQAKITLGGIYPTLCPEHARTSGADEVHEGVLEPINFGPADFSVYETPPNFAVIKMTRGCPFACSFCAVSILEGRKVLVRDPDEVVDEMARLKAEHGIRTFIFWESNLLVRPGYFEGVMDRILERNLDIQYVIPEGLMPRMIDAGLAKKLKDSGLTSWLALPLETACEDILKERFKKDNDLEDLIRATRHLRDQGIRVQYFVLVGFEGQTLTQALRSILFTWEQGVPPLLMAFTPIPGTPEYDRSRHLIRDKDLFELAPEYYCLASSDFKAEEMEVLRLFFEMAPYDYESILRSDFNLLGRNGKLLRNYHLDPEFRQPESAMLNEHFVAREVRKEYFLYKTRELKNQKTLVYPDVPDRPLVEGFSSVLLGRELDADDFDLGVLPEFARNIRDLGLNFGMLTPFELAGSAENWLTLIDELLAEGDLRVVVNDPVLLAPLEKRAKTQSGLRIDPGRLLCWNFGLRDLGRIRWRPEWLLRLPEEYRERIQVDMLKRLSMNGSMGRPAAWYYPYSILNVNPRNDGGSADGEYRILRRYDSERNLTLFSAGRGIHMFTPDLNPLKADPEIEILYQHSIPR